MTETTTITVTRDCKDRLDQLKRGDESWSDTLFRIADEAEGGEIPDNILTTDHLEDIANYTAPKTATEVEDRLR